MNAPAPQWQREFPDLDATLFPAIPAAWTDESWHNDICPHFVVVEAGDRQLTVWVDYPDPADREFPEWPRFRAVVDNADGSVDPEVVIQTDRWEDLIVAVRVRGLPDLLASTVEDRAGAEAFIQTLSALGLSYHFDDGAVDCLYGNGLVAEGEAMQIDSLVDACYRAWTASGADLSVDCPIGHLLEVEHLTSPAIATDAKGGGASAATPESVRAWLRENYSAQTIAGQPGHADPRATALVAWCNATENLARGNQSKADREQSERYVREGVPYLP